MTESEIERVDLVVIGAGSGGLSASKRAASYGARVVIAEKSRVGGTCVIRGCVPKKLMVYASQHAKHRRVSRAFGWSGEDTFSWDSLVRMRNAEVARLEAIHERNLEKAGVRLVQGTARLRDRHAVSVDGRHFQADHVLIATGARPVLPAVDGLETGLTSNDFFDLTRLPRSAILIGGGYIACEFAGILSGLGCQVTLVVRSRVLRTFDEDLSRGLVEAMSEQGVAVYEGATVERIGMSGERHFVELTDERGARRLEADQCVVFATGREPNTWGLGLEEVGVVLGDSRQVRVDEHHVTSVPNIYAVGDVTDLVNLTPVAIQAGRVLADKVFGKKDVIMDYRDIPTAVFSDPPIGTVGLTEAEARAQLGDRLRVFKTRFVPMAYSGLPAEEKQRTLIKLLVDRETDRVVGAHMLGDDAPELIQLAGVALKAGATKRHFDETVAVHPTVAEEFVLMSQPESREGGEC